METCPSCRRPTTADTRYPGSAWCTECVTDTLHRQDAALKNTRVKPQEFST